MVEYQALFEPDPEKSGFVVTFPDFDYGVTQGADAEEALEMAADLLGGLISDRIKEGQPLPERGRSRNKKCRPVRLPAMQSTKAELYSAFLASGIRKAELARRLGISKGNIERLFDLDHNSRLDQLEAAFAAIGKRLSVRIEEAA